MAKSRTLVIDNQTDLLKKLNSVLGPQGFDVECVEIGEDSIYRVKSSRPDMVFIRVQGPEKSGLSLCTRAKKAAGSSIPVILVSTYIAKHDVDLHSKQRYHADLYLEGSECTKKRLTEKLHPFIQKIRNNGSHSTEIEDDLQPQNLSPKNNLQEPSQVSTDDGSDRSSGSTKEEPSWIKELLNKAAANASDDASVKAGRQKKSVKKLLNEDWNSYNNLEQRLIEQEREIANLKSQVDDARRQARNSPFSSDYQNLREGSIQKEKEITILNEQLEVRRQQIIAGDERLEELAKRLLETTSELDELRAKEKEISENYQSAQTELSKLNRTFEESRLHFDSQIEKLTAEKIKESEEKHLAEIESLNEQLSSLKEQAESEVQTGLDQEVSELREDYENRIENLQEEHAAEIKKLQDENDESVESVRSEFLQEIDSLRQEHDKFLETSQEQHADEIRQLTQQIDELNAEHKEQLESLQLQEADSEQIKKQTEETLKSEHEEEIRTLEKIHEEQIEQLHDEIKELKFSMNTAHQHVDTEIGALLSDHQVAFKEMEKEHLQTIEDLKKQIEEEKKNADERLQNEVSGEIASLEETIAENEKAYDQSILSIKADYQGRLVEQEKEHTAEIEDLKKKVDDEIQTIRNEHISKLKAERDKLEQELAAANEQGHTNDGELKKKHEKELQVLDKKYKEDLHNLDIQYAAQLAELKEQSAAELQSLEKKLENEKDDHKETRAKLESQFAQQLEAQAKRA